MKHREKTRRITELARPTVKLTDTEILADLVYPAPVFTRDEDRSRGSDRGNSH